jgi:aminopeptidase N
VLGRERFDAAFREYIRTWAFKHPTPADFFRLMRDRSGMDLDWFWRAWVMTTARLDQAVDSVVARGDSVTEIYLSSRGQMLMPLTLALSMVDGDGTSGVRFVQLPVDMWNLGPRFTYRWRGRERVLKAVVDPDGDLPDVDRGNNQWGG